LLAKTIFASPVFLHGKKTVFSIFWQKPANLFCGHPNGPHCVFCSSVCLVQAFNSKTRRRRKTKIRQE